MNIVLIGYRGSGKTSVARRLADFLTCRMIDTDEVIARNAGRTIAEIFEREGESGFRDRECDAIRKATSVADCIISVGGGAVESAENRERLGGHGIVVWLDADPETLWRRIQTDEQSAALRPNLAGGGLAEVESVLQRRQNLYDSIADIRIDTTSLAIDAVVNLVVERLKTHPQ